MNLTSAQQKTVLASFLGWMLDAFDFFILVFVLGDIAKELGTVEIFGFSFEAAWALFFTLATRFIGAFIFGIVMMGEALTVARVASAALIVIGLIGLKLSSGH